MRGLQVKDHKSLSASLLLGAKALCEHCFPIYFRVLPVSVADARREFGRSAYRFIRRVTIHVA